MDSIFRSQIFHLPLLVLLFFCLPSISESNQFGDTVFGYGESTCGVSSPSASKILIKGGTVVNAHQQEVADVYVEDGIIVAVKPHVQ
ncbi:dihydropyrimidinase-like, partial [Morus notabilis]|uniref:dihydropyrimidinase-like n=1 Tax=Morus notabilis TaxID=981085 RepID=UPI000CED0A56